MRDIEIELLMSGSDIVPDPVLFEFTLDRKR